MLDVQEFPVWFAARVSPSPSERHQPMAAMDPAVDEGCNDVSPPSLGLEDMQRSLSTADVAMDVATAVGNADAQTPMAIEDTEDSNVTDAPASTFANAVTAI